MVFWKGFSVNRNGWNYALLGTEQEKKKSQSCTKRMPPYRQSFIVRSLEHHTKTF